jgi:hypothetical protein
MSRAYPDFPGAACHAEDVDPELFVTEGDRGRKREQRIAKAKAVCFRCKWRQECGLWAYRTHQTGIYGATTTAERDEMRRPRRAAAA